MGRPWTRLLLGLAVSLPALAIGGVPAWVVPAFTLLTGVLVVRIAARSRAPIRVPTVAAIFALLTVATALQWVPVPGVRAWLAPELDAMVTQALVGSHVSNPPGLTIARADTAMETTRLVGLTLLVVAAAQVSWRVSAGIVAGLGTAVALVGFGHELAGTDAIYGLYTPLDRLPGAALRGSFVNPNHQAGLLLLGIFCSAACALDLRRARASTTEAERFDRYGDLLGATLCALLVQTAALVLSLSRSGMLALLLLGPVAAFIGLRGGRRRGPTGRRPRASTPRVLVGLAIVLVVVGASRHAAWAELRTLADLGDEEPKLVMALRGLELVGISPLLGIGRGGFGDVFASRPAGDPSVVYTHLESFPLMALVEWGPLVGGVAIVGLAAWWVLALRASRRRHDAGARVIVLLGLAAMALQQSADFGLEFLGLAAPAAALLGSLSTRTGVQRQARFVRNAAIAATAIALAFGVPAVGRTWVDRPAGDLEIVAGRRDPEPVLRDRPLDGRLHAAIARRALQRGDLEEARRRAEVATALLPPAMDGWIVLASAEAAAGDEAAARAAMIQALDRLTQRPSEAFTAWLLERYPRPASLAAVTPTRPEAWRYLVSALSSAAPEHADAVAEHWSAEHPEDPLAHEIRSAHARTRGRPALALHHARLFLGAAPEQANAYVAVVRALGMFDPPRTDEMIDVLQTGLERIDGQDGLGRGTLEQLLLEQLLVRGDSSDRERASELAADLLSRPAPSREVRRQREQLARRAGAP